MFKKIITSLIVLALACSVSLGQPNIGMTYHEIQIVDEMGENVTDITSVSIYGPGGTTESTIYAGRNKTLAMTNPVTTSSTNSTLSSGYMYWWGPGNYDFSMTDGTMIHTNSGHRDRTPSEGRIMFPSFLQSISSTTYTDAQTITLGTGADWVINAGTTADLLTFTPATDGAVFRVGLAAGTKSADLQWYTASGVGLLISESANTLGITGLTTSINASSNYNTSINTGTSTGAISLGSDTSGAWAIDGTSTGTINADDSIAVTVSAGTIGIAATGGDLTIDATDKSVIIRGSEAVADAILIEADTALGGIDITSNADIDITTTGAAGEDISITNTGGSINLSATEDIATAIVISASTGGIDITADGAAASDLDITCTNGSVHIIGGEAIADAITAVSTGGVDITSAATFDIDLTATGGTVQVIASEAAANQFKVDATGIVAGYAIVLETTDGGVQINADGAANGDIAIDAADDMTITAAGNLTYAVTGTMSMGGSQVTNTLLAFEAVTASTNVLTAAESGLVTTVTYTGTHTTTLPQAAAGLTFTIIDNSATAADDVIVDIQAGDNIEGDTNGDGLICTDDAVGSSVTLVAVSATRWIVISKTGTWAAQ